MAAHEAARVSPGQYAAPPVKGLLTLTVLATIALGGCSLTHDSGSSGNNDADKRGAAVTCITGKGLQASEQGRAAVTVGDPRTGPRILFYLTAGQAEAAQFEGHGEGAEQIGSALLFVRQGSDDELEKVELCLNDL
jgi:hypothetical protein